MMQQWLLLPPYTYSASAKRLQWLARSGFAHGAGLAARLVGCIEGLAQQENEALLVEFYLH